MQKYINFLWFKYVKHIFSIIPIYKKTLFLWKKLFIHHITVGHAILSWYMWHNAENFFLTFFSTLLSCPNATDFRNGVVRFLRLRNHIGKDHIGIRFKYGPSYTPPKSPLREMYLNYIVITVVCKKDDPIFSGVPSPSPTRARAFSRKIDYFAKKIKNKQ